MNTLFTSALTGQRPAQRFWRKISLWLTVCFLSAAAIAGGDPESSGELYEDFDDSATAAVETRQPPATPALLTNTNQPSRATPPSPAESAIKIAASLKPEPPFNPEDSAVTPSPANDSGTPQKKPSPPADLGTYTLTYKTTLKGIEIKSQRHLERVGKNRYRAYGKASLMFLGIEEYSVFSVAAGNRILAHEYFYDRQGMSSSKDFHILFDWSKQQAVNQISKDPWQIPIQPGMLDMLSHQAQLRLDVLATGVPASGTRFNYDIVKKGKISHYIYRVVGSEKITTDAGPLDTLKIEKLEDDDERQTTVWLAKDWDYVIARLDHEEKGSTNRMELVDGTINGKKIE